MSIQSTAQTSPEILRHLEEGVLTLTLNRLSKKNAINTAMYAALADALLAAQHDATVRVVLIQGHESFFSAGHDLADFVAQPPATPDAPVFRFLQAIITFPKPLVAAVCGPAVGIGTTLLLHCDLVYAGDNAAFAMPFVNLGLCPEAGSSYLAPRLMGHARAAEALLLGEPFSVETAQELGLVNRIVPPQAVHALAQAQARKLAAKPPEAVIETKRLLKAAQAAPLAQAMAQEVQSFSRLLQAPAAREALAAFTSKSKG